MMVIILHYLDQTEKEMDIHNCRHIPVLCIYNYIYIHVYVDVYAKITQYLSDVFSVFS